MAVRGLHPKRWPNGNTLVFACQTGLTISKWLTVKKPGGGCEGGAAALTPAFGEVWRGLRPLQTSPKVTRPLAASMFVQRYRETAPDRGEDRHRRIRGAATARAA